MPNFYLDVIQNDQRALSPERINDMDLLEPVFRSAVYKILDEVQQMGIQVSVHET